MASIVSAAEGTFGILFHAQACLSTRLIGARTTAFFYWPCGIQPCLTTASFGQLKKASGQDDVQGLHVHWLRAQQLRVVVKSVRVVISCKRVDEVSGCHKLWPSLCSRCGF
jgi:hypothetical protein